MTSLLAAVAVLAAATAVVPPAHAQAAAADSLQLLDVPYLPQSEALCGGAATAMVMRYWGVTGVYAETFSSLVVPEEGGIRGEDLLADLRARGWDARSFRGDPAVVRAQLARRRPVVALVEDRPSRFHYVVVVGWAGGRVIAHDPAKAPFQVFDESAFLDAWRPSGFWTMLALPPAGASSRAEPAPRPAESGAGTSPCAGMVEEGVRLAGAGQPAAARRLLEAAAEACPGSSAPWREIAGLHALQDQWSDAVAAGRRAVDRDPADTHAWRIVATGEFVSGRDHAALVAWNRVGEPAVDLIDIKGLARTRYAVASRAMGLRPETVLTPRALETARRRLAELPAAQATRVRYTPLEQGRVRLDAVVLERPLAPTSLVSLAATGARAGTDREARVTLASPTGGGERITAAWRWWEARPAASLAFVAPAPFGGNWGIRAAAEEETFVLAGNRRVERRRGAQFTVSDWAVRGTRWELSAGVDRWRHAGTAGMAGLALEQRLAADRASLDARLATWLGDVRTWTVGLGASWRSSTATDGQVVLARAGLDAADRSAPMTLWPGAGAGHARAPLLRAHPLLDEGVVKDGVFGRRLAHGGVEWRAWRSLRRWPARYAPAVFVDTARAFDGPPGFDRRWHVDAGLGLRVSVPGAGILRLDFAGGLRDGRTTVSVGWTR